jgi:hypothetical protein
MMQLQTPGNSSSDLFDRIEPFAWLSAVVAATCLATAATAQEYRVDSVDDKARLHGAKASRWVSDAANYSADKASFAEYFQKYYFPSMTRTGQDDLAKLGDARFRLFKNFLWSTNNPELQKDLTDMAFNAMGAVVLSKNPPPYHPAVRYNAVLILGLLDEVYAIDSGGDARPPKPLAKANKALTFIVDKATIDEQFPPPVILGALIGLERHALYKEGLEAGAADAMSKAMLKLVNQDKPIQEMDPEAYAWLRMRAAGALAQLGSVGQNNAVHDALVKLAADFESLDDRCAAAALLAKLNYDGAKIDGADTAKNLLALAREVGAEEGKRAEDFESGIGPGGSYIPPADLYGTGGSGEDLERFPRRHVLARLTDLRAGLTAAKPVVPKDDQAKIDSILQAINPAIVAAADTDLGELSLTEAIRTMAGAIDLATAPTEEPTENEAAAL